MTVRSRSRRSRKLLVATVGVATVNYVAACGKTIDSSSDEASSSSSASGYGGYTSGNLVSPPDSGFSATSIGNGGWTSGNLPAPPEYTGGTTSDPPPAGSGGSAGEAGAAGATADDDPIDDAK